MLPPPPPPLPPVNVPGTEEWAEARLLSLDLGDASFIRDCVAHIKGQQFPTMTPVRLAYASYVQGRHLPGHVARLMWEIIEALTKQALEDDIPF